MKLNNITRQHVIKAFNYIDKNDIPPRRNSRTWYVLYNKEKYPPKYTISIANIFAIGQELNAANFISTEANAYLEGLGFTVLHY